MSTTIDVKNVDSIINNVRNVLTMKIQKTFKTLKTLILKVLHLDIDVKDFAVYNIRLYMVQQATSGN